jgi:virginiamycin B lyase
MPSAVPKPRRAVSIAVLVTAACLLFASGAAAESRLFWTNNETGTIGSANRAGGEVNQSLFSASPEPFGIAADSTHVYWSDEGTNELGRAKLDGSAVEPALIPAAGEVPEGLAVDGGHVYWANLLGQSIARANLDGSNPELKFIELTASSFPESVAIEGGHIYWASSGHGGEIGRANLDGSGVEEGFITGLTGALFSVAANSTHLYWSANTKIGRANLDGSEVEPAFIPGLTSASGIALDNEHIFWATFTGNAIARATLAGTTVEPTFITGAKFPDMVALSMNATATGGSTSAAAVTAGEEVHATATVGGGEGTVGTITFSLFGPGDETCAAAPLETFAVAVAGNGSYESPAVAPTAPGTYHWVAGYGGDSINAASASACAAAAFTVKAKEAGGGGNTPTGPTKAIPTPPSAAGPAAPELGPLLLMKVTRNKPSGIGHISLKVPSAGTLTVSGPGVKTRSVKTAKAGKALATLVPKGAYAAHLRTHHRGYTEVKVSFQPTSGPTVAFTRNVRLVKR